NPSRKNLYPGMLPADEEGMFAIVTDSKGATLMTTSVSAPDDSVELRNAKLKLASNGTLKGDVDEAYTGHRAEYYRRQLSGQSADQRKTWITERITRMFPDAEIDSLKIENVDDVS